MDRRSLFLGLVGTPYQSDMFTTTTRLADEAIRQDHLVTVWTCGYATALTLRALGETKPRNPWSWDSAYPSPSALVRHLIGWADGRLEWLVCRYCADERGTADQIPEVRLQPPGNFQRRALAADVCLVLGVK